MPGQRLSRPGPRGRRRAGEFDRDTQQLSEAPKVTASACLRAGVSWPCAGVRGCRGRQPAASRPPRAAASADRRASPARRRWRVTGALPVARPHAASVSRRTAFAASLAPGAPARRRGTSSRRGPATRDPRSAPPGEGRGLSRPRDPGTRGQGPRASLCSFAPTVRRMCRDQLEDPVFTRFFMKIPCVLEQSWG